MSKPSIDVVWERIKDLVGEEFCTVQGMQFTYEVSGSVLQTDRTDRNLSKGQFEKVLELAPLNGPGEVSDLVQGSSYIYAILHDERVCQGDW